MSEPAAPVFECSFPNRLADLGRATDEAMAFVRRHEAGEQAAYAVNLTIEELATNILKYGYDDQAPHTVRLRLELPPGAVVVVLEDDGHEFDPLNAPKPDLTLGVQDRQIGGLGICLVREFAEDLRYERTHGRNRLTVRIRR